MIRILYIYIIYVYIFTYLSNAYILIYIYIYLNGYSNLESIDIKKSWRLASDYEKLHTSSGSSLYRRLWCLSVARGSLLGRSYCSRRIHRGWPTIRFGPRTLPMTWLLSHIWSGISNIPGCRSLHMLHLWQKCSTTYSAPRNIQRVVSDLRTYMCLYHNYIYIYIYIYI